MIEQTAIIGNPLGLHARPAAQFVRLASSFAAEVIVGKDGVEINGKCFLGVMMLSAECGARLLIRATGPDEAAAVVALAGLVEGGFGEARP